MIEKAINNQDQDHQKGKDTREVKKSCSVKSPFDYGAEMKNVVNNRGQDHQKGKDTREVSHALSKVHLTMMLKNAVNNRDHKKEKDTIEVDHAL